MKKLHFICHSIPVLLWLLFPNASTAQQSKAGILFLNFHVTRIQNNESRVIELASYRVAEGELNDSRAQPQRNLPGQKIRCILSNSIGEILYETEVADPLMRDYEYPAENGNLQHVTIASDEGDFSLRLPYQKVYSQIRFEIIADEKIIGVQSLTLNLE